MFFLISNITKNKKIQSFMEEDLEGLVVARQRNLHGCAHGIRCDQSIFPLLRVGHGSTTTDGVDPPEHLEFHFAYGEYH